MHERTVCLLLSREAPNVIDGAFEGTRTGSAEQSSVLMTMHNVFQV